MPSAKQLGATLLISTLIISSIILAVILSLVVLAMNNTAGIKSFKASLQAFYSATSGAEDALMQVKKEGNNLIFNDLLIGGYTVNREFVSEAGECLPTPQCELTPGSGWWVEWFNYLASHPDMQVDPFPGPTPTPTEHDWFDDVYKTHETIEANLLYSATMWFPYDGTVWENKEGFAHDYHFGLHTRAKVTAASAGNYAYSLASDDDSWLVVNGIIAVNNSGTHPAFTKTGTVALSAGNNLVELYFAERHDVESGLSFAFSDSSLIITPWPEGCQEDIPCNSNIQATAQSEQAGRKARYSCNQQLANCLWHELTP